MMPECSLLSRQFFVFQQKNIGFACLMLGQKIQKHIPLMVVAHGDESHGTNYKVKHHLKNKSKVISRAHNSTDRG